MNRETIDKLITAAIQFGNYEALARRDVNEMRWRSEMAQTYLTRALDERQGAEQKTWYRGQAGKLLDQVETIKEVTVDYLAKGDALRKTINELRKEIMN